MTRLLTILITQLVDCTQPVKLAPYQVYDGGGKTMLVTNYADHPSIGAAVFVAQYGSVIQNVGIVLANPTNGYCLPVWAQGWTTLSNVTIEGSSDALVYEDSLDVIDCQIRSRYDLAVPQLSRWGIFRARNSRFEVSDPLHSDVAAYSEGVRGVKMEQWTQLLADNVTIAVTATGRTAKAATALILSHEPTITNQLRNSTIFAQGRQGAAVYALSGG